MGKNKNKKISKGKAGRAFRHRQHVRGHHVITWKEFEKGCPKCNKAYNKTKHIKF